ncbi:MAG: alkaline phosphatase family protein, partial [Pedobacter sp.]
MRLKFFIFFSIFLTFAQAFAQKSTKPTNNYPIKIERPKLVVGLVIDQMRWDYLYRYYDRYSKGGFKRLINEGFSAENTFIPYNVKSVGTTTRAGEMSPKNMLVTTITDELRLATNFKSKVIGISMKDRGSILPAGHSANAAYWLDGANGSWITSTYYMPELPTWVSDYNSKKVANTYFAKNWNTLYPIETYTQSTADDKPYEGKFRGETSTTFPHNLTSYIDKNYEIIKSVPHGNTMTLDFSKLAIEKEKLGQNGTTDFLAISCSSTDYVGHQFGPNSIEAEDTYLRLDKDLENFFNYLDQTLGKGNYLFFLSADHAAAHVPGFMLENKLPAGTVSNSAFRRGLDTLMNKKFNLSKSVITVMNNQVYFDHNVIDDKKVDFAKVKEEAIKYLRSQNGIADAVDLNILNTSTIPEEIRKRITNGYNARRSGDVYFLLKSNWFDGGATG